MDPSLYGYILHLRNQFDCQRSVRNYITKHSIMINNNLAEATLTYSITSFLR